MNDDQPAHQRQWRYYRTESGRCPIKEFIDAQPHSVQASILTEMETVRCAGLIEARKLRKEIWEVRAEYDTNIYRILFAPLGRFHQVLLAVHGFQKKTQQTPPAIINLAEGRLRDWRLQGAAKKAREGR
jgi:phage-related protein